MEKIAGKLSLSKLRSCQLHGFEPPTLNISSIFLAQTAFMFLLKNIFFFKSFSIGRTIRFLSSNSQKSFQNTLFAACMWR